MVNVDKNDKFMEPDIPLPLFIYGHKIDRLELLANLENKLTYALCLLLMR